MAAPAVAGIMAGLLFLTSVLARKSGAKSGESAQQRENRRRRERGLPARPSGMPSRPSHELPPAPKRGESPTVQERKARELAESIARTIQSGSATAMLELADELERRGQHNAADELRRAAAAVRRSAAPQEAAKAAATAQRVINEIIPPAAPPPERRAPQPITEDPSRQLALALTDHLWPGPLSGPIRRGRENKTLVKNFQKSAGLKEDGYYGAKSGLAVAQRGIVPARPFYFSRDAARNRKIKAAWTDQMDRYAEQDPERQAGWINAGAVARL